MRNMVLPLLMCCAACAPAAEKEGINGIIPGNARILNPAELPPNIIIQGADGQAADNVIVQVIEGNVNVEDLQAAMEMLRAENLNGNGIAADNKLIIRGGNWQGEVMPKRSVGGGVIKGGREAADPDNAPMPDIAPEDVPPPVVKLKSFSVGINPVLTMNGFEPGSPRLRVVWALQLQQPVMFNPGVYIKQNLDLLDANGKKVTDVAFSLNGAQRTTKTGDGKVVTWHSFYYYDAKLNGSPWYRLKGELKLPLSVLTGTEPYELPVSAGAEIPVIPPDMLNKVNESDIVVSGEGMDKIYIDKTEQVELNGEKHCRIELYFDSTSGSQVEMIELTDAKGKLLEGRKTVSNARQKHLFLLPPDMEGQTIHARVIYKKQWKTVTVPVDMKLDMSGCMVE